MGGVQGLHGNQRHTQRACGIVLSLHLLWGCSVLQPSPLHPAWAQKLLMEFLNCVHAPHNRLRHLDCPQRRTFSSHTRRGSGTRIFPHFPPFLSEHSLMQKSWTAARQQELSQGTVSLGDTGLAVKKNPHRCQGVLL